MTVPLNAPGAVKSIVLSQLYLGEAVSTRLFHHVRRRTGLGAIQTYTTPFWVLRRMAPPVCFTYAQ